MMSVMGIYRQSSLDCYTSPMKCTVLLMALALSANAQSPDPPRFDTGVIANGIYTNECMGFSLPIPTGWNFSKESGDRGTNRIGTHMPDGSIDLLTMDRHTDPPSLNRIVIIAQDATRFNGTPQDFVTRAVHGFVDADPIRYELLRNTFVVDYGGKQFYRSDYKQNLQNGAAMYLAFVFTKFRGHLLGAILMTRSTAALEEVADSLHHISFAADQTNPACIVGDNTRTGRMAGVIGAVSSGPKASRVRVSSGVARGLLVKKVDPQYPEDARKAGVQGPVLLSIVVSKEGNVEANINVISGDPKIVPAALDAVKSWKFKPFLLNGQPMEMETTVSITFEPLP